MLFLAFRTTRVSKEGPIQGPVWPLERALEGPK